jgi:hypothetical protein
MERLHSRNIRKYIIATLEMKHCCLKKPLGIIDMLEYIKNNNKIIMLAQIRAPIENVVIEYSTTMA